MIKITKKTKKYKSTKRASKDAKETNRTIFLKTSISENNFLKDFNRFIKAF